MGLNPINAAIIILENKFQFVEEFNIYMIQYYWIEFHEAYPFHTGTVSYVTT